MIDLSLYPKFQQDIQNKHTNVYPIIVIKSKNISQYENIYISTVKESIKVEETDEVLNFNDYGLKISSINESINFKTRKFQISNVSLSFNNYPSNGILLSDSIFNYGGGEVDIYLKSQSCDVFEDLILVYRGTFYDVSLNEKNINLRLEDLTEKTSHKDVPVANLGFADDAFSEKYKDVDIPIVYGSVDKAPSVIFKSSDNINRYYIIPDNVLSETSNLDINGIGIGGLSSPNLNAMNDVYSPLYLYKDNYFNVLPNINQSIVGEAGGYGFTEEDQFTVDFSSVIIQKRFKVDYPENPPANNMLQCTRVAVPNEAVNLKTINSGEIIYDSSVPPNAMTLYDEVPLLALEASIDTPDSKHKFLVKTQYNDFVSSHAVLPDNELSGLALPDETFEIAGFKPWQDQFPPSYSGVFFPRSFDHYQGGTDDTAYGFGPGYHWFMTAWCLSHASGADIQSHNASFINQPTPINIFNKANTYLINNGFNSNSNPSFSDLFISEAAPGYELPNKYCEQTQITQALFDAYWDYNLSRWIMQPEQGFDSSFLEGMYYRSTEARNLWRDEYETIKHTSYPAYLYRLRLKTSNDEYPGWQTEHNTNNIQYLYIGQWASIAQVDETWLNDGGTGLFLNIYDDGSGKPYLFEFPGTIKPTSRETNGYTEFGTYSFFELPDPPGHSVTTSPFLQAQYKADVTGGMSTLNSGIHHENIFGSLQGSFSFSSDSGSGAYFNVFYGAINPFSGYSPMSQTDYKTTGAMFFPDGLAAGRILTYDGHLTGGDMPTMPDSMCKILPFTIMPYFCRVPSGGAGLHYGSTDVSGYMQEYAYITPTSKNEITIDSGTDESDFGKTVVISYPFDNLKAEDVFDTITYAFGKVVCDFNQFESESSVGEHSYFNVIMSATDINTIDQDGVEVFEGANFAYMPGLSINLFKQSGYVNSNGFEYGIKGGDDSILNETNSRMWSSIDNLNNEDNLFFSEGADISAYRFPSWTPPDAFNALTLHFALNRDDNYQLEASSLFFNSKVHSIGLMQFILFENIFTSDFYIDTSGRANNPNDFYIDANGLERYKYVNEPLGNQYPLINNPIDIIYHFLEKELGLTNSVNIDNWTQAREVCDFSHAFSVKEKINSKNLIEDISSNSNFFPIYRGSNNEFSFIPIKYGYSSSNITINKEDTIKFKISATLITDVHTLVNVKYKKDYATDKYTRETGYCDGYDFFGNGDGPIAGQILDIFTGEEASYELSPGVPNGYKYSYHNLERNSNILEFESDFIRDDSSAVKLRDFLYLQNCNRHTIIDLDLPLKYYHIETGDIIEFDSLMSNLKPFGEDYTRPQTRNGQTILPYFMVTSTKKTTKGIRVKCIQMHELQKTCEPIIGSLTRSHVEFNDGTIHGSLNFQDFDILEKYLNNQYEYMTSKQKELADIGGYPNIISTGDLLALSQQLNSSWWEEFYNEEEAEEEVLIGDANQDGIVNVFDLILMVEYITGSQSLTEEQLYLISELADMNSDGIINIIDIVFIVNDILEG